MEGRMRPMRASPAVGSLEPQAPEPLGLPAVGRGFERPCVHPVCVPVPTSMPRTGSGEEEGGELM